MTKEEAYKENLVAAYITGQLFKNQLSCLRKHYDGPDKHHRYLQNKYREMNATMDVLFNPMDRELKKAGAYEELEEVVIKYHELIDKVLTMDKERFDKVVEFVNAV